MFELFKEVITPKEPVVEEAVIEENLEAKLIAMQLMVTMPSIGDTVRVKDDSVFDAGKIGVVSKIDEDIVIETTDGLVIVEQAQVDRLISMKDLKNNSLDIAFEDMYKGVLEGLESKGVDLDVINESVVDSMHEFIAESTYTEVTQADYANLVVGHLLKQFPKMSQGITAEPKKYDMLQGK